MTVTFQGTLAQMEALRAQANLKAGGIPRASTGPGVVPSVCPTGDCAGWVKLLINPPVLVGGSTYKIDLPDPTKSVLGRVPEGRTRLIVLGLGESGMTGVGSLADALPAGYPLLDGSCWSLDNAGKWGPLIEPTSEPTSTIPLPGVSWAGMFCWRLQQLYGVNYEVAFLPCALGGSTSVQWAVGGTLYNAALLKAQRALAEPRTVLHAFALEQGINDAIAAIQVGWAARWDAILAGLRAGLRGGSAAKVYSARDTIAVSGFTTAPNWSALAAEKASFEGGLKFGFSKPEGPFTDNNTHLTTAAQIVTSQNAFAVASANPGPLL